MMMKHYFETSLAFYLPVFLLSIVYKGHSVTYIISYLLAQGDYNSSHQLKSSQLPGLLPVSLFGPKG